ncbi:MAG: lipid-A-disaccharide synthase-related protein, partial [Cyanobacteriota bacterium]
MGDKLLCLSNGHGEDAIAVRILQHLQQHPQGPELAALPLVGEGRAYQHVPDVPIVGPVKA